MPDFLLPLTEKKWETHDVMTFRFGKPENFSYLAGQYSILSVNGEMKPFTFASSPTEDFLQITTMIRGSEFKSKLSAKEKGEKLNIKAPFGKFILQNAPKHVMLAGGIGITPFRSMIRFATDKKIQTEIVLLYSNKTPEDIAFREELEDWQKLNKSLKIIHTITREGGEWKGRKGRIDEAMIKEFSGGSDAMFYVCGPPAMVEAMAEIVKNIDVPRERIKTESFTGY